MAYDPYFKKYVCRQCGHTEKTLYDDFNKRIICDSYDKFEKHLLSNEFNKQNIDDFNKKISAVNNMYGWLYNQGILKKISFEFKDYSDVTYFAFDVEDLKPYRSQMECCGIQDAMLAVEHIFDVKYSPCLFSGAIELGWTMQTYRDNGGCIGKSWECELCKHLDGKSLHEIAKTRKEKGVKEAVKQAFSMYSFEPSDLVKED